METPSELALLGKLRRRSQCPQLPVFVVKRWEWHQRLLNFGCLSIRVRDSSDCDHDWSPIGGLACILVRDGMPYTDLGAALIAANPATLETFDPTPLGSYCLPSRVVIGREMPHAQKCKRDRLLERLLRYG